MEIFLQPSPEKAKRLLEQCGLPFSDINTDQFENFLYLGTPDNPSGLVGLEMFAPVALLRSLAVSQNERGKGYGRFLVFAAEELAERRNISKIYLLTQTAELFFKNLNYHSIPRQFAPDSIRNTGEFSGVCSESAVLMTKQL